MQSYIYLCIYANNDPQNCTFGSRFVNLCLFLIIRLALWILWEPAFLDALVLLKDFTNAPEAAESKDAKNDRGYSMVHQNGTNGGRQSQKPESQPALYAKIVLAFDNERMKNSYAEKRSGPNDEAFK